VKDWLHALSDRGDGFSGYRDNATKTNSLRDRILDIHFPDPEANAASLRPFLNNAKTAADLDRRIRFTDRLIDQIVYRIYGLSDDEVACRPGRRRLQPGRRAALRNGGSRPGHTLLESLSETTPSPHREDRFDPSMHPRPAAPSIR
jgi:hypothetical protein